MVLADTSVWIDHFRKGNERLRKLLIEGSILCHPFVLGELACGNLRNRDEILTMLSALPEVKIADHNEVLFFISKYKLHGKGIGWIDAHLLASSFLTGCKLWTLDKAFAEVSKNLGVAL